jgi:hypothetical protein
MHADSTDALRNDAQDQTNRGGRVDSTDNVWNHSGPISQVDFGSNSQQYSNNNGNGNRENVHQQSDFPLRVCNTGHN